jgi:uncharacterized membrane protein YgcG
MAETAENLVTFTPDDADGVYVFLKLTEPFVLQRGLKPDVLRAVVPWTEFAKFQDNPIRSGTLRFWGATLPGGNREADAEYKNMRVVEVAPTQMGVPRGFFAIRAVEFSLFIADFRWRMVPPRGGLVMLGLVNPALQDEESDEPTPPPQTPPAGGAPAAAQKKPRPNTELLKACLDRTGVKYELPAPSIVDAVQPAKNLHWFGSYATVELGKLLEHTGCVFCPSRSGAGVVYRNGDGNEPRVPRQPIDRLSADVPLPLSDQRGKVVIFTSAPSAAVETREIKGPSAQTWEFVIRDDKGKWREINDTYLRDNGLLAKEGAVETVRGKYKGVKELYRDQVRGDLYHHVRLADAVFKPDAHHVLRRRLTVDRKVGDLIITAARARRDPTTGQWVNGSEHARCTAGFLRTGGVGAHNVIHVHELLGRVKGAGQVGDLEENFDELKDGDLKLKVSLESAIEYKRPNAPADEKAAWTPEYYGVGFRRTKDGKDVEQLSTADLKNEYEKLDGDTVIIPRPELRLVREYDAAASAGTPPKDNYKTLDKEAKALAKRYLKDPQHPPRQLQVKGFFGVDLDGRVSKVQIDQASGLTTITLDGDWTPLGNASVSDLSHFSADGSGGGAGGGGSAGGGGVQQEHTALGAAGHQLPIAPLQPPPSAPTLDAGFRARVHSPQQEAPDLEGEDPPFRWRYVFQEVTKAKKGSGGWATLAGGREGGCWNLIEANNQESGLFGNGVSSDNLKDTSLKLQPVPGGTMVWMFTVRVPGKAADTTTNPPAAAVPAETEYWFQYENAIDGSCEPPGGG